MPKYMLILHDDPTAMAGYSAEEMQRIVERYTAWATRLAESGRHAGGSKLTDDGGQWLTRNEDRISCKDAPYAEAKEVIGGYFLIDVNDAAEARQVAEDCPHLDFGGRIELRLVDEHPGGEG